MNIDVIFTVFDRHKVDALLIGGMNFFLRHQPINTFDVDFWIKDSDSNLAHVANALRDLDAEWGRTEASWGPLPAGHDWLKSQTVFCLTTTHGAVDIFREVRGLEGRYDTFRASAQRSQTSQGSPFLSLSDEGMLACQLILPENERRLDRTAFLRKLLGQSP